MENDMINGRHSSNHGATTLDDEKSLAANDPPKTESDNVSTLGDPQAETERQKKLEGYEKFHRLGWKRLSVILIVEAIAIGSLSLPGAFATLGMVGGVISSIGIGLIATYASFEIGAVKIKYPEVEHYGDIGRLLLGETGFWIVTFVFIFQLVLSVGSHCLTGIIAFATITESNVCTVVFGLVSAIILLLLAIPPSFSDIAILGYIDITSIMSAIGITIIATGIQSTHDVHSDWSAWPKEGVNVATAMVAINNIVFAYSFAPAIPSFMNEMHTPKDYVKSIYFIGFVEITIYTLIGALVYLFVGKNVQSPALLSAGPLVSRIAFGIALPVIFISGSINTSLVARYIHAHIYRNSAVRYVNTKKGWITWIALVSGLTILAWVVAEVIPVFSIVLSISASLLMSGMCFYVPSIMWVVLTREGSWLSWHNILRAFCNLIVFLFGICILALGMYANVVDIIQQSKSGDFSRPFTCGIIN